MPIGHSGGAYANINPIQGNPIGDAITATERQGNVIAQEIEASKKAEALRKEQQLKLSIQADKESKTFAKEHNIKNLDNRTLNDPIQHAATDFTNRWALLNKELTSGNPSLERASEIHLVMNNLEKSLDTLAGTADFIFNTNKDITEGIKDGRYNPDSGMYIAKQVDSLAAGDWVAKANDDGTISMTSFSRDKDGNIDKLTGKDVPFAEYIKGYTPLNNYDKNAEETAFEKKRSCKSSNSKNIVKQITKNHINSRQRRICYLSRK